MKLDPRFLLPMLAIAGLFYLAPRAEAVPAFARQTELSCNTCHFQHFPKLNAFGRAFKASGYSKATQQLIEGDNVSLPPILNATLRLSTQYVDATEPTQRLPAKIEFPPAHGAAIVVAGRLAEGIGGYAEYDGALGSGKISLTRQLPFGDMTIGMTPFTADMGGVAYGFELLSTGANSMGMSFARAANPIGGDNPNFITSEKATGISFHAASPQGFLVYAPFSPTEPGLNTGLALSNYVRAAVTPNLLGWDLALGGGYYGGATVIASASKAMPGMAMYRIQSSTHAVAESRPSIISTHAWFADAQAQGKLFDRELGIYALYGLGDNPGGLFGGVGGKPFAWGVSAEYSLFPQLGLMATCGQSNNGDATEGSYQKQGVGLSYAIAQNILLQPVYEVFQGHGRPFDNRFTTLLAVLF